VPGRPENDAVRSLQDETEAGDTRSATLKDRVDKVDGATAGWEYSPPRPCGVSQEFFAQRRSRDADSLTGRHPLLTRAVSAAYPLPVFAAVSEPRHLSSTGRSAGSGTLV